jgi:galactokinase
MPKRSPSRPEAVQPPLSDAIGAAPGRVNLIGEHTDYNGGYVLPTALPQQTRCRVARRSDGQVRATSRDLHDGGVGNYTLGDERRTHTWVDYVQGVTWALREAGFTVEGFDLAVTSEVPIGKGLSSSASLEVSVLRGLRALFGLTISDLDVAAIAHRAETDFVGAPVGIMDQMVCSLGNDQTALFLDALTREHRNVAIPSSVAIGVIDSGIAHQHASGDYRIRRRECEEAASLLGVRLLRELTVDDLPRINQLPDPLNRRARHVVTEDARVLEAVHAMEHEDTARLGALFFESHASMRDDFAVSLPEIDRLVDMAREEDGVLGARLTGGGFGGAIVVLCAKDAVRPATDKILQRYTREIDQRGSILLPQ